MDIPHVAPIGYKTLAEVDMVVHQEIEKRNVVFEYLSSQNQEFTTLEIPFVQLNPNKKYRVVLYESI